MPKNQKSPYRQGQTTIVLTGGGSGGHITPLLSLARALKIEDPNCQVVYIGLKGDKISAGGRRGVFDKTAYVSSGKFRRYHGESLLTHLLDIKTLALNFRDLFKVMAGTLGAWRLLRMIKPNVVFSKGAYVALPVGLAAARLKIPIVTHDSDAISGLTNRVIGRWAKVHATGMPPEYYSYKKDTIRYIGVPVDERVQPVDDSLQRSLKRQIELPPDCLMLMVSGGGLGSLHLNELMVKVAPQLLKKHHKLHIVHFSGSGHQDSVAGQYRRELGEEMPHRIKVIGFSSDFYVYSGAADVVVARAGATTLAELALQGKAAVIIPSPFLAGGHQLRNADKFTTSGAAKVLPNDTSPQKLFKVLDELLQSKKIRNDLAQKISGFAHPDAAGKLADILIDIGTQ